MGAPEAAAKDLGAHPQIKCKPGWVAPEDYPKFKAKLGFDIELAPLVDSNFNRAKSNLRWLEASALKIPVVASNVGPYKKTNALTCSTTEAWVTALGMLIKSSSRRQELGNTGYNLVKKDYNLVDIAKQYAQILTEVHEGWQRGLKK